MEGLARLDGNVIAAGVEAASEDRRQIWLTNGESWTLLPLPAEPGYGLTSLDAHDGQLYVLERFWSRATGNRIRILRVNAAHLVADEPVEPELLATLEAGKTVDNFEGLAVLERQGRTILLLVSDDNYSSSQRTLILAFEVAD